MKRVSIHTASAAQLATYANAYLGLDVDAKMGAGKIRALMSTTGYEKDFIELEDEPAPRQTASAPAKAGLDDRVLIRIQNQPGAGGRDHVPINFNGTVYRIMRGVDVAVPRPLVEILEHAQTAEFQTDKDGQITGYTMVPTHPFSIVRDPA